MKDNSRILTFSCIHYPYSHPDVIQFLTDIKKQFNPTRIISLGDDVDMHAMNFHGANPDLSNAGLEMRKATEKLQDMYELFPRVDVLDSNHGSMVARRAFNAGIPSRAIRAPKEMFDAPEGWVWHDDLLIELESGQKIFFKHHLKKNSLSVAQSYGICYVQGHFHTQLGVRFVKTPLGPLWSLDAGCLIDDKALAFAYNKTTKDRPMIGCGLILNGLAVAYPMPLDKHSRYKGELW